jgi:1,4-alpha-glucan branching enzyme
MTLASEQIDQIVRNQYHNPLEILGPHQIEENGRTVWVVRSYIPNAESIVVTLPASRQEYPMTSEHHPHFFSCTIDLPELNNYQLKITEGGQERIIYDPYAFN